jgi:hypothetical protein
MDITIVVVSATVMTAPPLTLVDAPILTLVDVPTLMPVDAPTVAVVMMIPLVKMMIN